MGGISAAGNGREAGRLYMISRSWFVVDGRISASFLMLMSALPKRKTGQSCVSYVIDPEWLIKVNSSDWLCFDAVTISRIIPTILSMYRP